MEEKKNPYGLNFEKVSEEEIIKGAIKSGVAVFLHGKSSDGKSARVKELDPNCVIIYLRNATPDSLNGKSIVNERTGELVDIKPTWLVKLEDICAKEPDKIHILFFDEISNALPSIQGIAFNIVLEKEVNGKWHLPENARVVAAGNEMEDSLAANAIPQPLFNRFAHVYIQTTVESWLTWASNHNIHPAIYTFIAYAREKVLRTEYNGETPNADPRKWEMASKLLTKTGNPKMLRALLGEEVTEAFIDFCRQKVITIEDILSNNFTTSDLEQLSDAEKYVTIMNLSLVGEQDFEKARKFAMLLGSDLTAILDTLWCGNDEARLEKLMEIKMMSKQF